MDKVVRTIEVKSVLDFVSPSRVETINRVLELEHSLTEDTRIRLLLPHTELPESVVTIHNDLVMANSKYVPRVLRHLYGCAGIKKGQ